MNLLTDKWLPVRPLEGGTISWTGLSELLTEEKEYEICLPRDDLELAALQLVICIVQVSFAPKDLRELVDNCRNPMSIQDYFDGIESYKNWFELEHPEYPFMQVRGVRANKRTPIYRLLPGLADATNSCFVNEPGIANSLCSGCSAIALFNRAVNAPSFGGGALGGFKPGLRGSIPITTLVQGRHLRETIWLNVLTNEYLNRGTFKSYTNCIKEPTWVSVIKERTQIKPYAISLFRGLFWQPALIELGKSKGKSTCDSCGNNGVAVFGYFLTNQFGYTVDGVWPHPHSPTYLNYNTKTATVEKKFGSFKNNSPAWTQMTRFVVKQVADNLRKEGQQPAPVVLQAKELFSKNKDKITLIIGGYRNEPGKTASIAERRHETISLSHSWANHPQRISEIVELGLGYKASLILSLRIFDNGIKDQKTKRRSHKGLGFSNKKRQFGQIGETNFYRRTDSLMQKALAEAHFEDPDQLAVDKDTLRSTLKRHCIQIFEEQTKPYLHDPELIRTMAVARRTLLKKLRDLEPETEGDES